MAPSNKKSRANIIRSVGNQTKRHNIREYKNDHTDLPYGSCDLIIIRRIGLAYQVNEIDLKGVHSDIQAI